MYDLLVVGGGPAGVSAAVYAARKRLKTVLVAEEIGGQSTVSVGIENWIGTPLVAGPDLAKMFKAHLDAVKGDVVTLVVGERVTSLQKMEDYFKATTAKGDRYRAKSVLIASGAGRRKLEVPGAEKFENKGVVYCASCDGPLFSGMDVAVIGGGNAGFETALQLLAYAKSVTLLNRSAEFKADPVTVEKARAHAHMRILTSAEPVEVHGEQFVTGLTYKDKMAGTTVLLPISGLFVEIGVVPNTDYAKGLVDMDQFNRIIVDPKTQRARIRQMPLTGSDARRGESADGGVQDSTSTEAQVHRNKADEPGSGIWAAGDATDELYHQNNIAAGDGVKALEDIYLWIKTR